MTAPSGSEKRRKGQARKSAWDRSTFVQIRPGFLLGLSRAATATSRGATAAFAVQRFGFFSTDAHSERNAFGGPFFANDLLEMAQVAVLHLGGAIGKEDEVRDGHSDVLGSVDLRGVEELEGDGRVAHRGG